MIYVGKAVNIKKRVSGHFSNNSPNKQKQEFMRNVFHIRFKECESEEEAFRLETKEIKTRWPEFNRAQKRYSPLFGIVRYFDQTGFSRIALKQLKNKREQAILVTSVMEGHELLRRLVTEHELCLRLSGIPKDKQHCMNENCACCKTKKRQVNAYNIKVETALRSLFLNSGNEECLPSQLTENNFQLF